MSDDAPKRILVADDNRDYAEWMAILIELLGNEVLTASDGNDAIAKAEEFRPEVVLLDVGMPNLNGLDAAKLIREKPWGGAVKIFVVTGRSEGADFERTRDAGCDGRLVKPVGLKDLKRALDGNEL